jgi:hypothetical protein
MDKIESSALSFAGADERHNPVLMFPVATLKLVRKEAGFAGNKEFSADARARRSSYRRAYSTLGHFPLQCPEHLLGATGAVFGNGKKRIGNVKNLVIR